MERVMLNGPAAVIVIDGTDGGKDLVSLGRGANVGYVIRLVIANQYEFVEMEGKDDDWVTLNQMEAMYSRSTRVEKVHMGLKKRGGLGISTYEQ
jgi:hypothetical protein